MQELKLTLLSFTIFLIVFSSCEKAKDQSESTADTEIASPSGIGLQVYTLRKEISENPLATLQKISKLGYSHIETHTTGDGLFYGYTANEFKTICDSLGLTPFSMHVPLQNKALSLKDSLEFIIEQAKITGTKYLVVPYLSEKERDSLYKYKEICRQMNEIGNKLKDEGLQLAYHNHAFEFDSLEGSIPYLMMLDSCSSESVVFEMDLYWVKMAGKDPVDLFEKYEGRFPLWHVKDTAVEDSSTAAFGTGLIDFKPIFENKEKAGLVQYYIEQDRTPGPAFESVEQSITNIKKFTY